MADLINETVEPEEDFDVEVSPKTIPYHRFHKEIIAKKTLSKQVDELKSLLATKENSYKDEYSKLDSMYKDLSAKHQEFVFSYDVDKVLHSNKVTDPDDIEFIKYKFNKESYEEGQTKPKFSDWFTTFKDTKPKFLSRYEEESNAGTPSDVATTEVASKPALQVPKINKGVTPNIPSPSNGKIPNMKGWSATQIKEWYDKAFPKSR